ncbi:hypothetical protein [Yoonia sp.]|uniref:hypothetical protein n=1 Tax=Yoonia sp. TaxID=2212373 RepID=UPI003F6B8F84
MVLRIFAGMTAFCGALCAAAPALNAQDGAEGRLSVGVLDGDGSATGYLFGDFTLSASAGGWQAALGMFGVVGRLHETYADISYDTGTLRATVGFPRPAYDLVAGSAITDVMPRLALDSIGISRSRATAGTMFEPEFLPYGGVLGGEAGDLRYAISLHGVPDYDVTIAGSGLSLQKGAWRYDVGLEAVDQNAAVDWNTKLRLGLVRDRLELSLGAFHPAANGQPDAVEASLRYDLTDNTQITAVTRHQRKGDPTQVIGLRFDIGTVFAVNAGAAVTGADSLALSTAVVARF